MKSFLYILLCLPFGFSVSTSSAAADESMQLLQSLKNGGHIALLRHALAPGTGDPAHIDLENCDTQRNLNDEGREQARAIGQTLRDAGIQSAEVYSSQWCRCMDTARLLQLGEVSELEALNSFFQARHLQDSQTQALRSWLSSHALEQPVVLVTHQVNITALTGQFAASGELVIVKHSNNAELEVIGSVKTVAE